MRQKLEQVLLYQPTQRQETEERLRVYAVIDLDYLSASVLSKPKRTYDFKDRGFHFNIHVS